VIEQLTRDEILHLRHSVLRPGLPEDTARYPADADPDAFHLAARDADGTVISCVSFYPEALQDEPAWRFRGMATAPGQRGRGIGGELLEAGVAEVVRRGGRLVWCNGRTTARAFYERHGFTARGEEFDSPPAGPHYVMVRPLDPHPPRS
jgi:predicted GNAT family N-acyltransferase